MGETAKRERIRDHGELHVYGVARDAALRLYRLSAGFPREEQYSLTSQARRSSRSVCANIAEGWQKRRYPAAFSSKMIDAAAEGNETRCWLEIAVDCALLEPAAAEPLDRAYSEVIAMLVSMANNPRSWATR